MMHVKHLVHCWHLANCQSLSVVLVTISRPPMTMDHQPSLITNLNPFIIVLFWFQLVFWAPPQVSDLISNLGSTKLSFWNLLQALTFLACVSGSWHSHALVRTQGSSERSP